MNPRVDGHFIDGREGSLAVVLWQPPPDVACRFAALYVPPFGDEMNKARRTVAVQARALAAMGGMVALLDLRGTGDSGGEHGDATWPGWRADVETAWEWLGHRARAPRLLWGLRLGALLAADFARAAAHSVAALLLWQPVVSGGAFVKQLLRVEMAQRLAQDDRPEARGPEPRPPADAGRAIELAGYDVHPNLLAGIEAASLGSMTPSCPVIWRETTIGAARDLSPASLSVASAWKAAGVDLDAQAVTGPSFWTTQEIEEAAPLVASTTDAAALHLARCGSSTS